MSLSLIRRCCAWWHQDDPAHLSLAMRRKYNECALAFLDFTHARLRVDYGGMMLAAHEHDRLMKEWMSLAKEFERRFL